MDASNSGDQERGAEGVMGGSDVGENKISRQREVQRVGGQGYVCWVAVVVKGENINSINGREHHTGRGIKPACVLAHRSQRAGGKSLSKCECEPGGDDGDDGERDHGERDDNNDDNNDAGSNPLNVNLMVMMMRVMIMMRITTIVRT